MIKTSKDFFGLDKQGNEISKVVLENSFIKLSILDFGGIIQSLKVKNDNGEFVETVLGYDTIDEYYKGGAYFGATIGRFANRIKQAKFTLNNVEYKLDKNDGGNTLHGGFNGFDKKAYSHFVGENFVELSGFSADLEGGFPGDLTFKVKFTLLDDGVRIEYNAKSNMDTIINMTNHSYFNLSPSKGKILEHELMIDSDSILEIDNELVPTGKILDVKDTAFDFRSAKTIGKDIKDAGGYDHNYIINGEGFRLFASAYENNSKIQMDCYSDQNSMQLYSGNMMNNQKVSDNKIVDVHHAFCLETQNHNDSINNENFPSSILKKGETYSTKTEYRFTIKK